MKPFNAWRKKSTEDVLEELVGVSLEPAPPNTGQSKRSCKPTVTPEGQSCYLVDAEQLTEHHFHLARKGKILIIDKVIFEAMQTANIEAQPNEIMYALAGSTACPERMIELLIPRQFVSPVSTSVNAEDQMRLYATAEHWDLIIKMLAHSHVNMNVYTSGVDGKEQVTLLQERLGFSHRELRESDFVMRRRGDESADGKFSARLPQRTEWIDIALDVDGDTLPEEILGSLRYSEKFFTSAFITTNCHGAIYAPVAQERSGQPGRPAEPPKVFLPSIFIVDGPGLTDATRDRIQEIVKQQLQVRYYGNYRYVNQYAWDDVDDRPLTGAPGGWSTGHHVPANPIAVNNVQGDDNDLVTISLPRGTFDTVRSQSAALRSFIKQQKGGDLNES